MARLIQQPEYDAAALLRDLDAAGIRGAIILSMGYSHADERKGVTDPDAAVRAENDWTAAQVARAPRRLSGFCSVNPLRQAALAEIRRCTALPGMRGLKLHLGNSGVSLRNPAHADRLAAVFVAANAARAPVVVHMRSRGGIDYGAMDARLFLDRLVAAAPDIPVQVAHLGGAGAFPDYAGEVMAVFADAVARKDPHARRLYFDLTTVATPGTTPATGAAIAQAIRGVGVARVLFGTDLPVGSNPPPAEAWAIFRAKVPLTEAEFDTIVAARTRYAPGMR